ncbi:hypothetical protein DC498_22510 [Terrimonas sp.]|uniref:tetratricopeptide repeat protein n=1 Tax=Terrimonas sp. TaxID=1914338 RepID=UPI000D50664C|nr:hypothetical protein [Terrimonas sp.]PVD49985.1 hypothetical protein DC498_22510 [Terrimonas sp.]
MTSKLLFHIVFLFITFFINLKKVDAQIPAIKSQFATGFEKGFKEGYCYNTKSIYCNPAITPITPIPRINESEQSYQDGFNRGFQTGLDLQRVESSSGTTSPSGTNYSSIPNYKFNDYVPQTSVSDYVNVLAYKQALFNKRVQWVQQRIDGIYDLSYNLLSQEGTDKIKTSILNFRDYLKSRTDLGDFSDDRVIAVIASSLKKIEREVYDIYKDESKARIENERQKQFENYLSSAITSLDSDPKNSLQLTQEAEKMNIQSPYIYEIKSLAYNNLGMLELALENKDKYISTATLTSTEIQTAVYEKTVLLIKLSKYSEALIQLNSNAFNNADDTVKQSLLFLETMIYYGQKNYQNSLASTKKILAASFINEINKEDVIRIKQIKSASLRELGRYKEALDEINSAIKENNSTDNPSLYATKGKILFLTKDYKNAVNEFLKTTLLDDTDGESFYYLGLCYKKLNMKIKACETFLKAVKLGNPDALDEYPKNCK